MSNTTKKRVIKSYEKLTEEFIADLHARYPLGFSQHIIYYTDKEGKLVPAVPYETEDTYYLVKVPVQAVVVEEEAEVQEENSNNSSPESSHSLEELEELAYGGGGGGGGYVPLDGGMIESLDSGEEPDY